MNGPTAHVQAHCPGCHTSVRHLPARFLVSFLAQHIECGRTIRIEADDEPPDVARDIARVLQMAEDIVSGPDQKGEEQ